MENRIPSYLLKSETQTLKSETIKKGKFSFLDKTIQNSARAIKSIYLQGENAAKENFIHKINPHIKLITLLLMVIVLSVTNSVVAQLLSTAFIFLLFILAGLKVFQVYKRIFFLAFFFGFIVILPASLNIVTHGEIVFNIISFNQPTDFWIYHIPQNIGITENGLQVVLLVFLRVLNSISFALLIVFTTSFPGFIKSFKLLGIPDTFLMIIMLAYKYIFLLSRTIEEAYFALKSRLVGNLKNKSIRKLVSGRIFYIFRRSRTTYESTYLAMISRGYTGKIHFHSVKKFDVMDILALLIVVAFSVGILFI